MWCCAASNTAFSTSTTSKPTCCPPKTATWPGLPPAWAWPATRTQRLPKPHLRNVEALCSIRELVATEFDSLLHDGRSPNSTSEGCKNCGGPPLPVDSEEYLAKFPEPIATRLRDFTSQARVTMLSDPAKLRLAKLIGRATQKALHPDESTGESLGADAVLHFIEWFTPAAARQLPVLAGRTP